MSKMKYPPSAIRKCDKEIKALLQRIIQTKKGGTTIKGNKGPARKLNLSDPSGLLDSVKPTIKVKNGELFIDIEVIKYYQYLDIGSPKIKNPWFLTDELTSNVEFLDSIGRLVAAGIALNVKDNIKTIS